ncbi:lantibiotic dehydratase [Streptomyces sp. NPDC059881]|uniref:lantibiotic dehydratase n=1 Tax=Streptomyces sp. NPDC059881 TaxID=3346986 RepID=UPI00364984D8
MPFMLRVAALPVEAVRALRCPDSRRWAQEVLDEDERLRAAGEHIGDLLHALIGRNDDEASRRTLLSLRREVFNNRLPGDADTALTRVAALDTAAAEALDRWLTDRRALVALRERGAALLAAETARSRAALGRLAGEERLRKGLLLASPTLEAQLDTYVRDVTGRPEHAPSKKQRKIERSLLSYVYRTACKTSPFSTFTGVVPGRFAQPDGGTERAAGGLEVRIDESWTSHTRLNVTALDRLAEAVVADPGRRADLPVALAPGWGRDDDRVRYVRRWVTAGDDDTAVTFDAVKDRLFFLRRSGTLERLIALFEERGSLRYGELCDWLAADRGAPTGEAEQYLRALLDLGMVQVPALRTGVHDVDPLRAFQSSLRTTGSAWGGELADRLDGPLACVDGFPEADPAGRRMLLTRLRDELHAVQEDLGAERGRVPRTMLYEDAAAGRDCTLDLDVWTRSAARPLAAVERILPAFDLTLPQRITFKGFFVARYGAGGRCDDLLRLVHDFHEDFFDQYISFTARRTTFDTAGEYVPEENWLGLPQLKALDAARQTFVTGMRERWRTGHDGEELVLDDDFLTEVARELAPVSEPFAPMSHHVQLAAGPGGDPLVVLNRSYGGVSFPFSRFAHCFDGLEERLLRRSAGLAPEGAVLAEVTGGPVTSNLNLHGRLTEYEIVCPGETATLDAEFSLQLDDLYLVHDEEADRIMLRSERLGRQVIPVYLGYLVPLALPELARTLLLMSPTSMAPVNVWGGVPECEPTHGVTRRPRVRHAGVVLSRRSWSAPASALPLHRPGVSQEDWFVGWHAFRRAHRLPDRVFATVSDSGARGATGAKPQYLDFDSPLSLTAFEGLLKSDEARVVFREMLPDEGALHVTSERGRHVAELAVETAVPTRRESR